MASGRRCAVQHTTPEEWMNAVTTPNPLATLHLSVEGLGGTRPKKSVPSNLERS